MEIFRQQRENRRKEGTRWRRYPLVLSTALALLSSTLLLYMNWHQLPRLAGNARDYLVNDSYFSVREIKVKAGEKVGGSEIVTMAGLSHGMNTWKIDPRAIERKVAGNPWVKRVLVRREFPRRVVIEVQERVAKGIAVLGKLYYVDPEGFVFKEVGEGEKTNFPLLTGLQQGPLASQSHLARQRIQEALRLSDLMESSSFVISEIRFLPEGGVVLYPLTPAVALRMGWGDWDEKMRRLERILALWKGKETRLAALDLSFRDQVVARMRKG
jgi:cell division protein FtsQ